MPLAEAWRVVERRAVDISDLFGIVTASPYFKPARPAAAGVLRADQFARGPTPGTRSKYGNISHRRSQRA